jgi:hypothetical protein
VPWGKVADKPNGALVRVGRSHVAMIDEQRITA